MRILLSHCHYRSTAPSGEDAVYSNEKALLESAGIEIVTYEKHNDLIDDSTLAKKLALAKNSAWSRSVYDEVLSLINKTKPDIAHFHNTFPQISPSAYAACAKAGVPVIQTIHNYRLFCPGALLQRDGKICELCLGGNLLPALIHRCYRDSFLATSAQVWMLSYNRWKKTYTSLVDAYIALTEFSRKKLIQGGLPGKKIVVKPNFIQSPEHNDAKNRKYAVYVGRLSEEKGLLTLLTAWHRLQQIPLVIVGDGPLRTKLEDLVEKSSLQVVFKGQVSRTEVIDIVKGALFQVLPSEWYEGFPMVILEAFSCGTPVISSRIGSMEEIIKDGATGYKFSPGDPDDLYDKVTQFLNKTDNIDFYQNARREYEAHYTPENNLKKLLSIYEETLSNK